MRVYKFLPVEFALKTIRERRLKISRLDELNDPFDLLPFNLKNRTVRRKVRNLRDEFIGMFGLLCFSKAWRDPVIWAHYADKHRGMCLGFDIPKPRSDPFIMEVDYLPDRLASPTGNLEEEYLLSALHVKYENWAYEQEVRWMVDLPEPDTDGIHYHKFEPDTKLVEIIIGSESTVPLPEIHLALGDLGTKVTLRKAIAAFGSFRIRKNKSGFKYHKAVPLKIPQPRN